MNHLSPHKIRHFQKEVLAFYALNRREMPWRTPEANGTYNPYKILLSEVMLQQTQVARVTAKYAEFLQAFPGVEELAGAELSDVLRIWSGLGYNRRAKFLWQAARQIVDMYHGHIPLDVGLLQELPGIGRNTAAAICVYAAETPVAFIETNIRTVFLNAFFHDEEKVTDAQILELVQETLPKKGVRDWYYALMDLGAHYKATTGNPNKRSTSYARQKAFKGSVRQIRGIILKTLTKTAASFEELENIVKDQRLENVLGELVKERLIHSRKAKYYLGEK